MNRADMYKKILEMVKAGLRQGASKCGRKTDDVERNEFLREMRIFKDALEKFSPADRKLWREQVEAFNEDLIALSKRESIANRAASWRKTCARRVPNRQIKQAVEKRKRLDAIRKIVDEFTANSKWPTAKVVNKVLRESYKHLALVETDTVRKELSALKVARQSGG